MHKWSLRIAVVLLAVLSGISRAYAAPDREQWLEFANGDNDGKITVLAEWASHPDSETLPLLEALHNDSLGIVAGEQLIIFEDDIVRDAFSGEKLPAVPENAESIVINNRIRSAIANALAAIRLSSPDAAVRLDAVETLQGNPDEALLPLLDKALAAEQDNKIRALLENTLATTQLNSHDPAARLAAIEVLGRGSDPAGKQLLLALLEKKGNQYTEPNETIRVAAKSAVNAIDARLSRGEWLNGLFTGLSLASILLLAALGLAITFGLMGVINMAHGELIMAGAYATYVTQNLVQQHFPALFDWYPLFAVPVAFFISALIGIAMERIVIRHLYGRPLETLLATWGISLVLIQCVRSVFGAQNVTVENPSWLSGGIEIYANLVLPYNRLAILAFAALVVLAVMLILARTRLGLFVRAVTQNRAMARCMGVATPRVDMLSFGLGAGIAGLAGCALSQVGNVGPELGQGYIIDSFMVVVLGGVGQIAGTIYAALGLGVLNKFLEGWTGAVLAKIAILGIIIVFIQKRPQGLFALKGRFADA